MANPGGDRIYIQDISSIHFAIFELVVWFVECVRRTPSMLDLKEMSHFGGHLLEPQWGGKCGRKHRESTAIQVLPSGTAVDISNWSLPLWDWGCLAALQGLILQANVATSLESTCYMKPTCSASIRDGGRIRGLLWGIEWRATLSCGLLFGYGGTELGNGA